MKRFPGLGFVASLVFLGLVACSTPEKIEEQDPIVPSSEFSLGEMLRPGIAPIGCRKMLDGYCSVLNSPGTQGNLWVGHGANAVPVLQGRTKNDFTSAYYFYARAKLRAKEAFPSDFKSALEAQEYFQKLEHVLNRPARESMTIDGRIHANRRGEEVDRIWISAVAETVLRRLGQKFPGFHRLAEDLIPIEQTMERTRIRRELISEISRVIWKKDRNWARVETSFEKLRKHYLEILGRVDIPTALRDEWMSRIKSVKLVIPGALPAIADAECSTTQANAFYYPHLNLITVCAGDFNSEDILLTVAHELSHALDVDRSLYLYERDSDFGNSIQALRGNVCHPKTFSCDGWNAFKATFPKRLDTLAGFQPALPDFQRCLKRRPTKKALTEGDIDRLAEQDTAQQVSSLASSGVFLGITKELIPLANGKKTPNPNYLNPCSYRLWSQGEEPIDDDLTQLLFFTAEYRCSTIEPNERLRQAIALSKSMATEVTKAAIRSEGEFSSRADMEVEGFASSPVERFADVLGSYAFAAYLADIPDVMTRRYDFLASTSWQCDRPSLDTLYPEESRIQEAFVFDPHSEIEERKKEVFTAPIQSAVDCVPDFKFAACELKFKDRNPSAPEARLIK
jgi:hypothetical protein